MHFYGEKYLGMLSPIEPRESSRTEEASHLTVQPGNCTVHPSSHSQWTTMPPSKENLTSSEHKSTRGTKAARSQGPGTSVLSKA